MSKNYLLVMQKLQRTDPALVTRKDCCHLQVKCMSGAAKEELVSCRNSRKCLAKVQLAFAVEMGLTKNRQNLRF